MLEPTDKVSFGLMSELPGCNVSERRASLVKDARCEPEKRVNALCLYVGLLSAVAHCIAITCSLRQRLI